MDLNIVITVTTFTTITVIICHNLAGGFKPLKKNIGQYHPKIRSNINRSATQIYAQYHPLNCLVNSIITISSENEKQLSLTVKNPKCGHTSSKRLETPQHIRPGPSNNPFFFWRPKTWELTIKHFVSSIDFLGDV